MEYRESVWCENVAVENCYATRELLWLRHENISGNRKKENVRPWKPLAEDSGEDTAA
jgi:hypothetical protein